MRIETCLREKKKSADPEMLLGHIITVLALEQFQKYNNKHYCIISYTPIVLASVEQSFFLMN